MTTLAILLAFLVPVAWVAGYLMGRKATQAPVLPATPVTDVQTGKGATQSDLDKVLGRKP